MMGVLWTCRELCVRASCGIRDDACTIATLRFSSFRDKRENWYLVKGALYKSNAVQKMPLDLQYKGNSEGMNPMENSCMMMNSSRIAHNHLTRV